MIPDGVSFLHEIMRQHYMGVLRTNFHLKWIFRIIAEVKKKSSWSEKKKKKRQKRKNSNSKNAFVMLA